MVLLHFLLVPANYCVNLGMTYLLRHRIFRREYSKLSEGVLNGANIGKVHEDPRNQETLSKCLVTLNGHVSFHEIQADYQQINSQLQSLSLDQPRMALFWPAVGSTLWFDVFWSLHFLHRSFASAFLGWTIRFYTFSPDATFALYNPTAIQFPENSEAEFSKGNYRTMTFGKARFELEQAQNSKEM